MKIKADISINRRTSRGEDDVMCIRVSDRNSHIGFLEIEMSMSDFAYAITGLSGIQVDADVRGLNLVGKVRESRTEFIECVLPLGKEESERIILDAAAPLEVDGWKASAYLALNTQGGRKLIDYKANTYRCRVELYRYVDATKEGESGQAD